ncbi:MAG: hypothetical protein HS126_22260 [Anaerolineales bacterium]|nr:hypothetical protein [Anaerolineales bacterium]
MLRKVLFTALFIVLLLSVPPAPLRAASPLEMTAQPAFGGRFKYGEWLPVFVDMANSGPDLLGEIQVTVTNPTGRLEFALPAELPSGARKRFTLYILPNNFSRSATVEFAAGETRLTRTIKLAVVPNDRYIIGAVMAHAEGLAGVNPPQLAGRRERVDLIQLTLADLPERHQGWRMLNALILNDVDTSGLTPAQCVALSRWVADGGRLVVGGGSGAGRTLAGLPAEVQPVTLGDQVETAALPGLEHYTGKTILVPGPFLVAESQPVAHAAVLLMNEAKAEAKLQAQDISALASTSDSPIPLIVELPFGAGYVDFIALDLSQSPFDAWAGATDFARQFLSPGAAWPQYLPMDVAPQQMSDSQIYYALTNLPSLDLPSIRLLGLLLIGYILLVGPVNYFLLRWRDRLAWAWVTIPFLTVIFSGLAYGLGFSLRGSDIIVNQISIIEMGQTGQTKRADTYAGIFSPHRQSYTVEIDAETLVRPIGQNAYDPWSGAVNNGSALRIVESSPALLQGLAVDQWSMQSFVAEMSQIEPPGLTVQLTAEADGLRGQVSNQSSVTWEDVIFVFNGQFQKLGNLMPGQTVPIRLDAQNTTVTGFGSYLLYQDQSNQAGELSREITFKQSVLDGIIFNGNRPDLNDKPLLIAWQKNNSPLAIRLEGAQVNLQATSLLYYPLSLDFEGAQVVVPPGFGRMELLSTSGDASTCSYGAGLDGSYVYQGTAETRLSLPYQLYGTRPNRLDLYIRTDGSWPALPSIELYDRTEQSWVVLKNAKRGFNSIQDITRFYNSADASLQVRISNDGVNAGGCLFLDLALEGERL